MSEEIKFKVDARGLRMHGERMECAAIEKRKFKVNSLHDHDWVFERYTKNWKAEVWSKLSSLNRRASAWREVADARERAERREAKNWTRTAGRFLERRTLSKPNWPFWIAVGGCVAVVVWGML